ncbi:FxsB family radical SAM/SPASM domain protein [Micromonospora orduensis]|uniref:FxsB family radical SAM/SPASM domain protein n=1 Tax=Micromonospora orduensis TaxID=1420891 RepID=A0A5C4QYB9_9ACTN|nr:FxsB family radical SAM/SPASM domain protein [Micromonospora orduensis]
MTAGRSVPAPPGAAISQYVLKVHSRCDLSCDHCYVYEHADQTWRGRPREMATQTLDAAAARIAEHASAHDLPVVHVVLHGGEPLLLGPARMRRILSGLRTAIEPTAVLDLRMQTNGVRLDPTFCDIFVEYDVKVGISLDGDRVANDRHRRFANGASSHDPVRRALALLRSPEYRDSYAGILCTVDVANDPDAVYDALLAEEPPRIDLLLPHHTWDHPPVRPGGAPTPYADWLGRIHRRWVDDGRPVSIRLFDALDPRGTSAGTEAVGLGPADLVVVETDGTWEQADSLKVAYDGAAGTGLTVFDHTVDEAARHPGVATRQSGLAGLSAICRSCPVVVRCGGGLYAHRYRSGAGFDNPSVYCTDLRALISIIDRRAPGTAPVAVPRQAGGIPAERQPVLSLAVVSSDAERTLDDIAGGHGDPESITFLVDSQLAIVRALLAASRETAAPDSGWDLLVDLDATVPDTVRAVLRHPFVRPRLIRRLQAAARPVPRTPEPDPVAALAAAVAVRAGVAAELRVPVLGGQVFLPTLGVFRLPFAGVDAALLTVRPGGFRLVAGGDPHDVRLDEPTTWPSGWLPTQPGPLPDHDLTIEDLDPARDCYGDRVRERLAGGPAAELGRTVATAWQLAERDVPRHAEAMSIGMRAVVPLDTPPTGALRSATARAAFGAVAVGPIADPATLAVLLVHEWQHSKLGAALDLYDLVEPGSPARLRVAWRPDPRPLEGVLQGAYAHLAVAEVWHARAVADRPADPMAATLAARYRTWTGQALDALAASGSLTGAGDRFVEGMRRALAELV